MTLSDLFTPAEVEQIKAVYNWRNGNIVLGTMAHIPFYARLGLYEEARRFFAEEWNCRIPERRQAIEFLKKELAGKKVIELGPGIFNGVQAHAKFFQDLGAREYIGVEPMMLEEGDRIISGAKEINRHFAEGNGTASIPNSTPTLRGKVEMPVTAVASDGLSYLLTQPDKSAVVYSERVFRPESMLDVGLPEKLAIKYRDNLIAQIGRVTPRGAISLHLETLGLGGVVEKSPVFDTELWVLDTELPSADTISPEEQLSYELKGALGFGGLLLRKRQFPPSKN